MLARMVRRYRSVPDPLATASEPRWLVIRDRFSRLVAYRELPARTDLKAAMAGERQRLIADGWHAAELTRRSFCYCERGDERWCISIEHYEPGRAPVSHGSSVTDSRPSPDSLIVRVPAKQGDGLC
jgi:hypothetical protein